MLQRLFARTCDNERQGSSLIDLSRSVERETHNKLTALLQKYSAGTKEEALLLSATQGEVVDVRSLVTEFNVPLNVLCRDSELMPIELAYKHDKLNCVVTLMSLHQHYSVYAELVELLHKYKKEQESCPHKELVLARAIDERDESAMKLLVKKYGTDETLARSLLDRQIIYLIITWRGYQNKKAEHENRSVSSFLINIGHNQFKANLSAKFQRGFYPQNVLLSSRSASAVYPGDFGGTDEFSIVTGLPVDFSNFLSARVEELSIEPTVIDSTYTDVKINVNSIVTTIKDKMVYRLDLQTDENGQCSATFSEIGIGVQGNSTVLLQFKLKQIFKNLFIMKLNQKNPCFFPSNFNAKNSPMNPKIDKYFNSFVDLLDTSDRDRLAWKAELEDISPFITELLGTYKREFNQLLINVFLLQFDAGNDQKNAEMRANEYMTALREKYVIKTPLKEDASVASRPRLEQRMI